jgi:ribose transport system substrate-binding protein
MRGRARRRVALFLIVATALALASLTSCEKSYHQENERYIFVASNVTLPYWQEAAVGFKDAAMAAGVKFNLAGPESYSPDDELDAFQKAVDRHPSGILVAPARADKFSPAIDAAVKEGIPVICVDSDAPNSHRIMFIGTDNYRAGFESGAHVGQLLHGQGNVVIVAIPGQFNQDERIRGAKEALAGYTRIKVTSTLDDRGDPRTANDQISVILEKKQKVDAILSLEASGGPGSAEALHRMGMEGKVKIVAFDKNPETIDWIVSGVIAGSLAQKPYTMAYYGLRYLDDLHHNIVREFRDWRTAPASPLPSRVDTGTAWVDKSNIEAFKAAEANRLRQMGGPLQPTTP